MDSKKTLLVRLEPDLHKQIKHFAIDEEVSLNQLVNDYFKKCIKNYKRKNKSEGK